MREVEVEVEVDDDKEAVDDGVLVDDVDGGGAAVLTVSLPAS